MERRKFIRNSALTMAGTSSMPVQKAFEDIFISKGKSDPDMFIGTPVLPEYLYEQGIPETLDAMKELAAVNTVMTFSHDHVFRQYRHGYTPKTDSEGNPLTNVWVKTHEKYYANPQFQGKDFSAKYADRDILDELEAAAQPTQHEGVCTDPGALCDHWCHTGI